MKKRSAGNKLTLSRETLASLSETNLERMAGGTTFHLCPTSIEVTICLTVCAACPSIDVVCP